MKKLLAALGALVVAGSMAGTAGAQDDSQVYVVHGIPGTTVDVYVNGEVALEGFEPSDVAGPLALPAGSYEIEVFAAGADPAADAPVITANPDVPGGANLSVVAHLDESGAPTLTPFVNDVAPTAAGNGRVTVRHTAAAPTVDIVLDGAPVEGFTGIANGSEAVGELPAGSYATGIAAAGTTEVVFDAPVTVTDGVNTVVYAIGDLAGGSFALLAQELSGLQSAPTAVAAGNSGLAATEDGSGVSLAVVAAVAMLGVVALGGGALAFARRRS